jgi:hypothetical protein
MRKILNILWMIIIIIIVILSIDKIFREDASIFERLIRRDSVAFEKIKNANSIEKYQTFIRKFPNSEYAKTAESNINKLFEDELSMAKMDTAKIRSFIGKYSTNYRFHEQYKKAHIETALNRINKIYQEEENRYWSTDLKAWNRANDVNSLDAYKKYIAKYPHGNYADVVEKRIIDLEVDNIMADSSNGTLPSMDKISSNNSIYSSVEIENNTSHILTVLYSGIDSKRIVIQSKKKERILIKNGGYRIAASVNSAGVRSFAGQENLTGGEYSVSYYISHSGY